MKQCDRKIIYLNFGITICKSLLYISSNGKENLLHVEVGLGTLHVYQLRIEKLSARWLDQEV